MVTTTAPPQTSWPSAKQEVVLVNVVEKARLDDHSKFVITDKMYDKLASQLQIDFAVLKAFAIVESKGEGFINDTEPTILFERHWFYKLAGPQTKGLRCPGLPKSSSLISWPSPGGYGKFSHQHTKLEFAVKCMYRIQALKSCSWGAFQIMGVNHKRAGYANVQVFVNDMYKGVEYHLQAFGAFIKSDPRLHAACKRRDYGTMADLYNGLAHDHYDLKISSTVEQIEQGAI